MGSLATGRIGPWRTALLLGRVSNLPTVWSNVIAASALAGGGALLSTAVTALAISLMYVGGMYLNDAFDREIDARERPERPIPSGSIAPELVFAVGAALLVIGIVLLAFEREEAGLAGLALGGAIILYNWHHKGNPVAPFVMGLCRALVYVAAGLVVFPDVQFDVLVPAAALLAYVAGLTFTARLENVDRVTSLWPLSLLAAPVIVAAVSGAFSPLSLLIYVMLAAVGWRVATLLRRRAAGDVSQAVALLIAAISLVDALFATTTGVHYAAIACLLCFGLTLVLQRFVPAT
ncbi:UbiA family prenyltransferase [Hyphomicrobium sulfonivorans]|uniref:UbiA family prenyltransferase n=1 Tax=Hyphomicrobium sulfonivorans TaxID=121290 RepID=UPI00156F9556|nr:UbiA family prenyltransferase [Hyphomicrobium sulfonivorans]MBI1649185.1 UbiA family prenyltransferase [Hyphomicrobium sulfonivorans]NSL70284.1 prenyltransferase [Hyphomicrobium sulfonivorans]